MPDVMTRQQATSRVVRAIDEHLDRVPYGALVPGTRMTVADAAEAYIQGNVQGNLRGTEGRRVRLFDGEGFSLGPEDFYQEPRQGAQAEPTGDAPMWLSNASCYKYICDRYRKDTHEDAFLSDLIQYPATLGKLDPETRNKVALLAQSWVAAVKNCPTNNPVPNTIQCPKGNANSKKDVSMGRGRGSTSTSTTSGPTGDRDQYDEDDGTRGRGNDGADGGKSYDEYEWNIPTTGASEIFMYPTGGIVQGWVKNHPTHIGDGTGKLQINSCIVHCQPHCSNMRDPATILIPYEVAPFMQWCQTCAGKSASKVQMAKTCDYCNQRFTIGTQASDMESYAYHILYSPCAVFHSNMLLENVEKFQDDHEGETRAVLESFRHSPALTRTSAP